MRHVAILFYSDDLVITGFRIRVPPQRVEAAEYIAQRLVVIVYPGDKRVRCGSLYDNVRSPRPMPGAGEMSLFPIGFTSRKVARGRDA